MREQRDTGSPACPTQEEKYGRSCLKLDGGEDLPTGAVIAEMADSEFVSGELGGK